MRLQNSVLRKDVRSHIHFSIRSSGDEQDSILHELHGLKAVAIQFPGYEARTFAHVFSLTINH